MIELIIRTEDTTVIEKLLKYIDEIGLKSIKPIIEVKKVKDKKPLFMEAVKPIRQDIPFKEIMKKQSYQPITYAQFREQVKDIKWQESLEDLLGALSK